MSYVDARIKKDSKDADFRKAFDQESERLEIAIALMALREEEGLTQQQLAEKVGKPQSTIARIENGTLNPSFKLLSEIAHGIGRELKISFA